MKSILCLLFFLGAMAGAVAQAETRLPASFSQLTDAELNTRIANVQYILYYKSEAGYVGDKFRDALIKADLGGGYNAQDLRAIEAHTRLQNLLIEKQRRNDYDTYTRLAVQRHWRIRERGCYGRHRNAMELRV